MKRLGIFVSGNGTNCENIIRYFSSSKDVEIALVLSNKADAYALTRAKKHQVPTTVVNKSQFNDERYILQLMDTYKVDYIILAGFLLMIPDFLIEAYPKKIINIHPALLPKYGGKGMYGMNVHNAVKAAGEKVTGITIHFVNHICDGGEIIAQYQTELTSSDTPENIAEKVHKLEQLHFPKVIELVLDKA